ncbi:MAG: hypothetical protein M0P13_10985, partial [Fibrobacteraceae bacterium]|nr:hypothetical protein [Fibrobacteraceae bacterium]
TLTFPEGNRILVVAVSRCSILTPAGPAQSPALRTLTFPDGNRILVIKIELLEVPIIQRNHKTFLRPNN